MYSPAPHEMTQLNPSELINPGHTVSQDKPLTEMKLPGAQACTHTPPSKSSPAGHVATHDNPSDETISPKPQPDVQLVRSTEIKKPLGQAVTQLFPGPMLYSQAGHANTHLSPSEEMNPGQPVSQNNPFSEIKLPGVQACTHAPPSKSSPAGHALRHESPSDETTSPKPQTGSQLVRSTETKVPAGQAATQMSPGPTYSPAAHANTQLSSSEETNTGHAVTQAKPFSEIKFTGSQACTHAPASSSSPAGQALTHDNPSDETTSPGPQVVSQLV